MSLRQTLGLVARATRECRLLFAAVVLLLAIERSLLVALGANVVRRVEGHVLGSWTLVLAVFFVLRSTLRGQLSRTTRCRIVHDTAQRLLSSEWGQPLTGDLTGRVHEGLFVGQQFLDEAPTLLGTLLAMPVVVAIVTLTLPKELSGPCLLAVATMIAAVLGARGWTGRWMSRAQQALAPVYDDLGHALGGRWDIASAGVDDEFLATLRDHLTEWRSKAAAADFAGALAGRAPLLAATAVVGMILLLDSSLRDVLGHSTLKVVALGVSAVPTFLGLAKSLVDLLRSSVRLQPFLSLFDMAGAPAGAPPDTPMPPLPASIAWSNVSFAYPDPTGRREHRAIHGVKLEWAPHEMVVLHGRNGSGKSTLFRLLLGLSRPSEGYVRVGGVDLFDLDLRAWRRSIAYLPQRPYLPERATARTAIRLLARQASDEQMKEALERTGVWGTLVAHAPHDPLDAKVEALSVGERQRVALARLLCQPAKIVLLDEPDANLDAEGIRRVVHLARELRGDRMVAIAAHSPELLREADRAVYLREGTIVSEAPRSVHTASSAVARATET